MNRKDFLSIFGLSILGTAVVGSDTFTAATKDVEEYPEGTVGCHVEELHYILVWIVRHVDNVDKKMEWVFTNEDEAFNLFKTFEGVGKFSTMISCTNYYCKSDKGLYKILPYTGRIHMGGFTLK